MNYYIILLGLLMAAIDAIALPMVSIIHTNNMNLYFMIFPVLIYSSQLFIFKGALNYGSLAQMNMAWDVTSGIIVTLISILIFKELLTKNISIGLVLGLLSIIFLSR
jgi:uncharacterized membrane protein